MKKVVFLLSIFLLATLHNAFAVFRQVQGIEDADIRRIAISELNPERICVTSQNSLYESSDSGRTYQKTIVFKDEEVRHLFFDPHLADTFYVVTSRHLYKINNGVKSLFSRSDEQTINTAQKYKGFIFVGTNQGLHYSAEDVLIWNKAKSLGRLSIYDIEPFEDKLYLAAENGVYIFSKEEDKAQRLFVVRDGEEQEEDSQNLALTTVKADIFNNSRLWMGTNRGLFVSDDKGSNWRKVYAGGVSNLHINCIVQTKMRYNAVYIGTDKGFFTVDLDKDTAKQIFEGLSSSYIWWAEFSDKGEIYLATAKGLFKNNYFTTSYKSKSLKAVLVGEPSIRDIQQASLKYNEVHPHKIKKWRQGLKYRALFPEVSLDYDKTVYGSYNGKFAVGPYDWGVSCSWDVGDLVWNSSETSIDVRSRLNTQLRLDILDEINRVYFERLRLKGEINGVSLGEDELFAKELRLKELTAIIDGYTGGFFSQKIEEFNEQ